MEEESKRNNLPQVPNLREVQLEGLSLCGMAPFYLGTGLWSATQNRRRGRFRGLPHSAEGLGVRGQLLSNG